jgi:hypothetical protein
VVHVRRLCVFTLWALGFYGLAVTCPLCPVVFVPLTVIWMTFAGRIVSALVVEMVLGPVGISRPG